MPPLRPTTLIASALLLGAVSLAGPTASAPALEQRVRLLDDREAIRQVLIRYGEYLDAQDYGAYAALFARDGVWTGGFGSATGPAAIRKLLEDNLGKPAPGFINKSKFHLMTTEVADVAPVGDRATVRSRYMVFVASPEGWPVPSHAGRYIDSFVREGGAWKIARRATHGVIPWRDGNAPPPAPAPPSGKAP